MSNSAAGHGAPARLALDSGDGPAWVAARWAEQTGQRDLPAEIVSATRDTLVDWFGCALAGLQEPVARAVAHCSPSLAVPGDAPLLTGQWGTPAFAAMLHGTAAHAMDFDDTHIYTDVHFSAPTWAAVLASLRRGTAADDALLCRAFVAGFEVGAKLAGRRLGHAMHDRGFNAVSLMGRLAGATACAVLRGMDTAGIAHALTLGAGQTAGFAVGAGSMMKPFQVGKGAFDSVIAAELAASGLEANPGILGEGGIAAALIQDGFAQVAQPDFDAGWELLRNSTKAYPCQHGIHPTIDAARGLHERLDGGRITQVRVYVGPLLAGRNLLPANSHEARFSIPFCVAVGLTGRGTRRADFSDAVIAEPEIQRLMRCIEIVPVKGRKMYNAAVDVRLESGRLLEEDVPLGRGHPGRPLSAGERRDKFFDLAEGAMGEKTGELLAILEGFPGDGRVEAAFALVRAQAASASARA